MNNAGVEVRECMATVTAWDGERGTVEPHVGPAVALLTATTVKAGSWSLDQVKVGTVMVCEIVVVDAPDGYASVVRIIDVIGLACVGGKERASAPLPEKPDDGGPAYPLCVPADFQFANEGMTLRDRFAIAALPALIKRDGLRAPGYAKWAYEMADAMLAARKGGSNAG